ncbi:MAG: RnfABCDGE type electron transport complex subunit C [Erysipelotrichaceae bacterium]|nr:RnfABCDGE type electron transport complex subunit C [Erysipelotrichaceae bacterium]
MSFLLGPMCNKIPGHKDMSVHEEVITIDDHKYLQEAYIPLAVYGGVTATLLVKEGDHVLIGQKLAERNDNFYVPVFASISGTVKGIVKRMGSNLRPADHLVIENDFKYETIKADPFNWETASKEEILEFTKSMGLVGQGGAGFPTYFKYRTDACEMLIINGVECEPYITSDAKGMECYPEYFREGVRAMFKMSGAKKCVIALKEYKVELIKSLKELFSDLPEVEVIGVKDAYPMGWERKLVETVTGKTYERLPIETGSIVSNSTSAIKLGESMKTGLPMSTKMVTVSGEAVNHPANVICRLGTPIKALIESCGGLNTETVLLVMGGPMMGNSVIKDEVVINKTDNALTILHYVESKEIGCLRCGRCVDHCPAGLEPVNIVNAYKAKNNDLLNKLKIRDCIECGMCSYVCPSKIDVTEYICRAKRTLK